MKTIGLSAFSGCSGLTSITIPNSVTAIGDEAFWGCSGLTSIDFPNSVTSIGNKAFKGCGGLTSITIPNSVTSIGNYTFQDCSGLTSITIPNSVTTIGLSAFEGCSDLTSITIPSSVTSIGPYAFNNTKWYNDQPDGVVYVGKYVYKYKGIMPSGTSIILKEGTVGFVENAFSSCSDLASITIPNSVTSIGNAAFIGCTGLTSITIPSSVTSIGNNAFSSCTGLTSIMIPSSVTSIGKNAFSGCNGLTSITIPNGVTSIGESTFYNCSGLTSITIPNSVTSIGSWGFYGCSGLTSIISKIENPFAFGSSAFSKISSNCILTVPYGIKDAYIAKGWTESVFKGGITEAKKPVELSYTYNEETKTATVVANTKKYNGDVVIPSSVEKDGIEYDVTSIGNKAFYYCTDLTSVSIPNSVTSIGYEAFKFCTGMKDVSIPNSVTNIGLLAFYGCSSLTSIYIPSSVTIIENRAFAFCSNINTISVDTENSMYDSRENCNAIIESSSNTLIQGCRNSKIPDGVLSIGYAAFYSCPDITSIVLPVSVTSLETSAFQECLDLQSITIPNSITKIDNYAFGKCAQLTSVTSDIQEPFTLKNTAFIDIASSCTLTVPYKTKAAYIAAGWTEDIFKGGIVEADPEPSDLSYTYNEENKTATVVARSNKYTGDIIIPKKVEKDGIEYSVTSIGSQAFENCKEITSVMIPNSVKEIGSSAFHNCIGLMSIELSDGLESIDEFAFNSCESLTTVSIPTSVKSIGSLAFAACVNLLYIDIPESVTSIGGKVLGNTAWIKKQPEGVIYINHIACDYNGTMPDNFNLTFEDGTICIAPLAFSPNQKIASVVIPDGVVSIGNSAFGSCGNLASIVIPNSVTSIGSDAFVYTGLSSIDLPDNLNSIGSEAFYGCSKLTSIVIPSKVTSIGDYAFYDCNKLASVESEINEPFTYGANAFLNISSSCTLTIPAGTKDAYLAAGWTEDVFKGGVVEVVPSDLTYTYNEETKTATVVAAEEKYSGKIIIPSTIEKDGVEYTVTALGWDAFENCTEMTSVSIPNTVTSIGVKAFANCSALTSIALPNSVKEIGLQAFAGCDQLANITFPDNVHICDVAFDETAWYRNQPDGMVYAGNIAYKYKGEMPADTHIDIQEGTTSIASYAFNDCANLTSVSVPNTVTYIGNCSFTRTGISSLDIPNSVTQIETYAVMDCPNLKSLFIPKTVTSIGGRAFTGCGALETIVVEDGNPVYDSRDNCNAIIITESNKLIAGSANTTIPEGVVAISEYALGGITGFTNATFPESLASVDFGAFDGTTWFANQPDGLVYAGKVAYQYKGEMPDNTTIEIKDGTVSISSLAFDGCKGLKAIKIPSSLTNLAANSFKGCDNLTSIQVNKENTVYDSRDNCNAIIETGSKTLVYGNAHSEIPYGITSIGWSSFTGSKDLKSITLPEGLSYIDNTAFEGCVNLTSVVSEINEPFTIDSKAFKDISSNCTLTIPAGTKDAYLAAGWTEDIFKGGIVEAPEPTNYMFAKDTKVGIGKSVLLPIYMENDVTIANAQFDIYLPSGISIKYDADEEAYMINKGERLKTAHTIGCNPKSDGSYRITITSTTNATMKDTDKSLPVMYIPLEVASDITIGDYNVVLRNMTLSHYDIDTDETTSFSANGLKSQLMINQYYTLTAQSNNAAYGSVTIEGESYDATEGSVVADAQVTLTATPEVGFRFTGWTVNGETVADNPLTMVVDENKSITANFTEDNYTITFKVDDEEYSSGSQQYGALLQTPETNPAKEGYTFIGWEGLDESTTVPANDVTYNAVFEVNKYNVKFIANGNAVYDEQQDFGSDIIIPDAPAVDGYDFVSWGTVDAKVPSHDVEYVAEYVKLGDLNGDDVLNVGDLTDLIGIILENRENQLTENQFRMADLNKDGKINIADYTVLVGKILRQAPAPSNIASLEPKALTIPAFNIFGNADALNFSLSNIDGISALQFDVTMPAGVELDTRSLMKKGLNQHSIACNRLDDGTYRVVVFSFMNAVFGDNNQVSMDLLSEVKDAYNVKVSNIVCASEIQAHRLSDIYYTAEADEATGLDEVASNNGLNISIKNGGLAITATADQTVRIYTTSGALVSSLKISAGETQSVSLEKGVHLINGKKVIISK